MENALWKGPGICATDCMMMKNWKWIGQTMEGCNGGNKIGGMLLELC